MSDIIRLDHEPLTVLDPYAGPVSVEGRWDSLATISAGYRDAASGRPVVSRDGRIYVSGDAGRASGLRAELEASECKEITIALVHEPRDGGVQQRYTRYSATALEAHGDEAGITLIGAGGARRFVEPGDSDWEAVRRSCKAETFLYFALARWTPEPQVVFPDGFGLYRLRMTSRASARALMAQLDRLGRFTGGRVAGIPLTASISYQDLTGPDGKRRNCPVWQFVMRPPQTMAMSARQVGTALHAGLREADALALPAPDPVFDLETAVDLDESDVASLASPAIDKGHATKSYFSITAGTPYAEAEGRAALISEHTSGALTSLSAFLDAASPDEVLDLMAFAAQKVAAEAWRVQNDNLETILAASVARVAATEVTVVAPDDAEVVECAHAEEVPLTYDDWLGTLGEETIAKAQTRGWMLSLGVDATLRAAHAAGVTSKQALADFIRERGGF